MACEIVLTRKTDPETRESEKDRLVLLMLGRDDLLLSGTSIRSAVLSDIDTSAWRNRESLRVRYFSCAVCQERT